MLILKQYFLVEETDVYLTNGTGGTLRVYDDSRHLEQSVLIITRIIDEDVSNIQVGIK